MNRTEIFQYHNFLNKNNNNLKAAYFLIFSQLNCSFLKINLAYVRMERGDFVGDGWEDCNLFGLQLLDGRMEREEFLRCSMGNTRFERMELSGVRFCSVAFMGSVWRNVTIKKGKFKNCNFRGMCFIESVIEKTTFQGCVFDKMDMKEVTMSKVVFVDCVFL